MATVSIVVGMPCRRWWPDDDDANGKNGYWIRQIETTFHKPRRCHVLGTKFSFLRLPHEVRRYGQAIGIPNPIANKGTTYGYQATSNGSPVSPQYDSRERIRSVRKVKLRAPLRQH
jgi:hypothetical protein